VSPAYVAFTAYGVPIVGAWLGSRREALQWAEDHGHRWPGAYIVQRTATGPRVVWRWTPEACAA
jgi:hypothetical protein